MKALLKSQPQRIGGEIIRPRGLEVDVINRLKDMLDLWETIRSRG
nr:MAG TPA: hypothetical protein [Bacteriophage sp.]